MKKAYIVHGWGGSPEEEIHKSFKQELESKEFEVHVLEMPNTEEPQLEEWIPHLKKSVQNPTEETFFIGHSIGCQTILRFLQDLPEEKKIGGCVLLAPWTTLLDTAYENPEEEQKIAEPWMQTPIDWIKVKSHCNKFTAIFSDDDFCVTLSEKEVFEKNLGAKIIVEKGKGHFTMETNVSHVPSVVNEILEMSR